MYMHLGFGAVVNTRSIIGIFDIDYCSVEKRTREFLRKATQSGQVVNISDDLPKSFVLCSEKGKITLYITGISPATLTARATARRTTIN